VLEDFVEIMNKIRLILAIFVSRLTMIICRLTNRGGTALPGKIALKIYPGILGEITRSFKIITVTGTNGKTTTTGIIAKILESAGIKYISNKSGANLLSGITGTFVSAVNFLGQSTCSTALIEIDEAVLSKISFHFKPDIIVVTNFFRDQLDRYGEIYTVLEGIKNAINNLPESLLVLNADDSLCASLGRNVVNKVIYYGINNPGIEIADEHKDAIRSEGNSDAQFCIYCKNKYEYAWRTYGHLGEFKCMSCGYERPEVQVACTGIDKMTDSYSSIRIHFDGYDTENSNNINISLPGLFNVYNALAASACGIAANIPYEVIIPALSEYKSGFGRMEEINAGGKTIKIILVKNPAGFNQVLDYLSMEDKNIVIGFIVNNMAGDGVDTSWLWDVDFEKLNPMESKIQKIFISGARGFDMGVRLKYAGLPVENLHMTEDVAALLDEGLEAVDENTRFFIMPTYTAMLEIRKILKKRYNLKNYWK